MLRLYIDGGTFTGGVYWSVAIQYPNGIVKPLTVRRRTDRFTTNNEAEYLGVCDGLKCLARLPNPGPVTFFSDSKLVVNQMQGTWRIKEPRLADLRTKALTLKAMAEQLGWTITFTCCPRAGDCRTTWTLNFFTPTVQEERINGPRVPWI